MDTNLLVTLAIVAMLLVIAAASLARGRRSGAGHRRTVERTGGSGRPEAGLPPREQPGRKLEIVPLAPHEAQRYRMEWHGLQARFADRPRIAVAEADLLVRDVMRHRGYPMADFESRADAIAADHPLVVQHYRAAHAVALRERRGEADTEVLRQALVHYRALFAELLAPARAPVRRPAEERWAQEPRRTGSNLRPERAFARSEAGSPERERRSER